MVDELLKNSPREELLQSKCIQMRAWGGASSTVYVYIARGDVPTLTVTFSP